MRDRFQAWLAGFTSGGTKDRYGREVPRFLTAAGIPANLAGFELLTPEAVHAAATRLLEAGVQPATVRLGLAATRRFFFSLFKHKRPFADPPRLKHAKPPAWNVLNPGEHGCLLEGVDSLRDRAILIALCLQGWRASELCALKWGDLTAQADGSVIASFIGKQGKPARQYVFPQVIDAARAWAGEGLPRASAPFIAKDEAGHRLTRFDVYHVVKAREAAVGHKITPHGLRATYISEVIAKVGIERARQLARHESISTTQRYSRWNLTQLPESLAMLAILREPKR